MELTDSLLKAISLLFAWDMPFWIVGGLSIGMVLGSLPGVSGVLAITLLLGPSYYMEPLDAIIFFSSIYSGSIYGGGLTAVLLNIPGTPSAIVTAFDGYALTKKGEPGKALGIGIMSSAVGMFVSYILCLLIFLPLGKIVLKFGPAEMLMVVTFALISVGLLKGEVRITITTGLFGILLGTIGSSAYGHSRGTFGQDTLLEGIPIVPALLGMLAISELLVLVERPFIVSDQTRVKLDIKSIYKGMLLVFRYPRTLVRGTLIGTVVGLMPAAGSTIASIISYGFAKKGSKDPDSFGQGNPEGIIAAETANNASEGGAVSTMMLLGIPGSVTTALLIAAFMIHGLAPGPFLIREHLDFAYAVLLCNLPQALALLVIAPIFVNYFGRLVYLPTRILVPGVLICSVVGALAPRGLLIDAVIMFIFGILGYVLKKIEFPVMGLILGLILGRMLDNEMIRAILMYADDPLPLFARPTFIFLLTLNLITLFWPKISKLWQKKDEQTMREKI